MNLSKQEAYQEIIKGNKITHWLFSSDEYLYIDNNGIMRDECGYDWTNTGRYCTNPWEERSGVNWRNGWEIWKEEK